MWLFILTLFYFCLISRSEDGVSFRSCEEGGNSVLKLRVIPCNAELIDDWPTCVIKHGKEVQVKAFFLSAVTSTRPIIVTSAVKNGVEVTLHDTGSDPCDGSIVPSCPLVKEKVYAFNRYFETPEGFPAGFVEIKFGILDERTNRMAVCAKVPIFIEDYS